MAGADYRDCDLCGTGKVFYDSNLGYVFERDEGFDHQTLFANEPRGFQLGRCGNWAVLCLSCSETHTIVFKKKSMSEIAKLRNKKMGAS